MKKLLISSVIIIALIAIGITTAVLINYEEQLDTPKITLKENLVTWEPIENAEKYEISVNGILYYVDANTTNYKLNDGESFSIRAIGSNTKYTDSKWSDKIEYLKPEIPPTFEITWKNGNEILAIEKNVPLNTIPCYKGNTPSKEKDELYSYEFVGWDQPLNEIVSNTTFNAVFKEKKNTFKVKWLNNSECVSVVENVTYDAIPAYNGDIPYTVKDGIYYTFSDWETHIDLETNEITKIANYNFDLEKVTVEFQDFFNETIATVKVDFGTKAICPIIPQNEDYIFLNWDQEFDKVESDLQVKAVFNKLLTVKFIDYNDSVIDVQKVQYNGTPIEPQVPIRNNYVFVGWDKDYNSIQNDLEIKAQYKRVHHVSFLNYDGEVLKEENVIDGATPIPPNNTPFREGYDFSGWNKEITPIFEDTTFIAEFQIKYFTVQFYLPNGRLVDTQIIPFGSKAQEPIIEKLYFDWNTKKAFEFTSWNNDFTIIDQDLKIIALYDKEITTPVIVVETIYCTPGTEDVSLNIYLSGVDKINGLSLFVEYNQNLKLNDTSNITIDQKFKIEDYYSLTLGTPKESSVSNILEFCWTNGSSLGINQFNKILTLKFKLDKYLTCDNYLVEILNNTYIIGADFKKQTPIVITGQIIISEELR